MVLPYRKETLTAIFLAVSNFLPTRLDYFQLTSSNQYSKHNINENCKKEK